MQKLKIGNIPALLWGGTSEKGIVAVHGSQSHKADTPIEILAQNAVDTGYQVLSFDLPGHGDRKDGAPCKVQACVADLAEVMDFAGARWQAVSLFANSLGAYLSLMACASAPLEKAWFLSPLLDMQRMTGNMMRWSGITEERLRGEQAIATPMGPTLYWDDYVYVQEHPVRRWTAHTEILYGEADDTCERDTVEDFACRFSCGLEIVPGGEHYFHTPEQLSAFDAWLKRTGLGAEGVPRDF